MSRPPLSVVILLTVTSLFCNANPIPTPRAKQSPKSCQLWSEAEVLRQAIFQVYVNYGIQFNMSTPITSNGTYIRLFRRMESKCEESVYIYVNPSIDPCCHVVHCCASGCSLDETPVAVDKDYQCVQRTRLILVNERSCGNDFTSIKLTTKKVPSICSFESKA